VSQRHPGRGSQATLVAGLVAALVGLAAVLLLTPASRPDPGADDDLVETIIRGVEYNTSLIPRGRGTYLVTKLCRKSEAPQPQPEGDDENLPPGVVKAAPTTPPPVAWLWQMSWGFDADRFRCDIQTILPKESEWKLHDGLVYAYDGERAFAYYPQTQNCFVAQDVQTVMVYNLRPAPWNYGPLIPTMLGRAIIDAPLADKVRAEEPSLLGIEQVLGDECWRLGGKQWTFWVTTDGTFRLRQATRVKKRVADDTRPDTELRISEYDQLGEGTWIAKRSTLRLYRLSADRTQRQWWQTYCLLCTEFDASLPEGAPVFTLDRYLPAGTQVFAYSPEGPTLTGQVGGSVRQETRRILDALSAKQSFGESDE